MLIRNQGNSNQIKYFILAKKYNMNNLSCSRRCGELGSLKHCCSECKLAEFSN